MKYDTILILASKFYKYSEAYTLTDVVKNLQNLKSFAARLKYCVTNFKRLGAGTSRIAFLLPDGKVLKLAKNAKGIAQNNTESDYALQNDATNKVLDSDEQDWWLITNLATRVNPAMFQSQIGISFEKYCRLLNYWDHVNKGRLDISKPGNKNDEFEKILDENQFVRDITELIMNGDLALGDFCRINSYGNVNGKIVIIDFGTSMEVYDQYYKR